MPDNLSGQGPGRKVARGQRQEGVGYRPVGRTEGPRSVEVFVHMLRLTIEGIRRYQKTCNDLSAWRSQKPSEVDSCFPWLIEFLLPLNVQWVSNGNHHWAPLGTAP